MSILFRHVAALGLTLTVALVGTPPPAGATTSGQPAPSIASVEEMDDFVRWQLKDADVPGISYAVVAPHGVVHAKSMGHDGGGEPVTAGTPFLWGSVAKPLAATLAIRLAKAGELDLDAPVARYLPDFRLADRGSAEAVTVRRLLSQTSGLPTSMTFTDRFETGRRPADVVPELADAQTISEPGAEHHYSSLNYLVLSAVVEAVTGQAFHEVLTDHVLEPLGMDTMITTPAQAGRRLPPGHRYVLGNPVAFTAPFDPAGPGYGYVGGTLGDLARFARAHLGGAPEVLDDRALAQLHRPETTTGEGRGYGLGWRRWSLQSLGIEAPGDVVWHGGAAPGYWSMVVLLPGIDRAVVVEHNAYGSFQEPRLLDTAWGLAALLYGEEPVTRDTDVTYPLMLTGLAALMLVLGVLVARSGWLLARGRRTPLGARRVLVGLAAWTVLLTGLSYLLARYLPARFDVGLDQMALWAPDLAWAVYASLAASGLLLLLRWALAVRSMRRR